MTRSLGSTEYCIVLDVDDRVGSHKAVLSIPAIALLGAAAEHTHVLTLVINRFQGVEE